MLGGKLRRSRTIDRGSMASIDPQPLVESPPPPPLSPAAAPSNNKGSQNREPKVNKIRAKQLSLQRRTRRQRKEKDRSFNYTLDTNMTRTKASLNQRKEISKFTTITFHIANSRLQRQDQGYFHIGNHER